MRSCRRRRRWMELDCWDFFAAVSVGRIASGILHFQRAASSLAFFFFERQSMARPAHAKAIGFLEIRCSRAGGPRRRFPPTTNASENSLLRLTQARRPLLHTAVPV